MCNEKYDTVKTKISLPRPTYSTFSHTHKSGNNGINANFVSQCICSFLHYLYIKMLVNVKSDVS